MEKTKKLDETGGERVPRVAVRKAGSGGPFRLEIGGASLGVTPAEERKEPPSLPATFVPSSLRKCRDIADAVASEFATREFLHDSSAAKNQTRTLQEKFCALSGEERKIALASAKMVARDSWKFVLEFCLHTEGTLPEYRIAKEERDRVLALSPKEQEEFTRARIDAVCADPRMAEKLVKAWMLHEENRMALNFVKDASDACNAAGIRGACTIAFETDDAERHDLVERLKMYAALDRTRMYCNGLGARGAVSGDEALAKLVDAVRGAASNELVESWKRKSVAELRQMVEESVKRTGIRYIRHGSKWAVL